MNKEANFDSHYLKKKIFKKRNDKKETSRLSSGDSR